MATDAEVTSASAEASESEKQERRREIILASRSGQSTPLETGATRNSRPPDGSDPFAWLRHPKAILTPDMVTRQFRSDLEGVSALNTSASVTLDRLKDFANACRRNKPKQAETALCALLVGNDQPPTTMELFAMLYSLYDDYLTHGRVRVPSPEFVTEPTEVPTACEAVLQLVACLQGDIGVAIVRTAPMKTEEVQKLTNAEFVVKAMSLWSKIRSRFDWLENACADLRLKLADEFAAAKQRARQSPSVAGKPAAPQAAVGSPDVEHGGAGAQGEGAADVDDEQRTHGDVGDDSSENGKVRAHQHQLFSPDFPDDVDLRDLAVRIDQASGGDKTKAEVAREFTGETIGSDNKAKRLLARLRKHRLAEHYFPRERT